MAILRHTPTENELKKSDNEFSEKDYKNFQTAVMALLENTAK